MFGKSISEVTFYHPGTPQAQRRARALPLSAKASTGDFPQLQSAVSNRSSPRSQPPNPSRGRGELAAHRDSWQGISVLFSQRTGRLGPLISEAKIILRFLLRNPHSKARKMQRAQTETYFPCGYPAARLPALRHAICASLGKTQ